jgi:hypothetical protein
LPTRPRRGEHPWNLEKAGRRVDCRLLEHGEHGVEMQLFPDREFYGGRRFATRALADAFADAERLLLMDREGWSELN